MKQGNGETVREPQRDVPVYGACDVLVVGGGPAGTAAAVAAAREGADVVLLERYGHLGGLSTGGLVFWIDRMTDWEGNLVIAGIGQELIERVGLEHTLGPPPEQWGSKDPTQFSYWAQRTSAWRGIVQWSPTVDPEMLKLASNDIVREAGVHVIFHTWVVATVQDGGEVRGVIFESKEGRKALLAKVVVDCTGDGDIFAFAGAEFDNDIDGESANARINTSFRFGNVDMRRYLDFRMLQQDKHRELMSKAVEEGVSLHAHATASDTTALFMTPKMSGYSPLSVADLTAVEFRSRDVMRKGLAFYRQFVPGFERAWILDTAQQIGVRHARRLGGVGRVTIDHWRKDGAYADTIGLCPGLTPEFPTLEIPYSCLVPRGVEGLIAAGRNLSADQQSHAPLREIPECWVMGQAAGIAATLAVSGGRRLAEAPVAELQSKLEKQGAIVHRRAGDTAKPVGEGEDAFKGSIHFLGSTAGETAAVTQDQARAAGRQG
ncbi:MAG TPA: FAD-dependent oxidoreductase [Dehalococcoidia bacterium]|nr:FAD-dependent oxidoreductase [Dehalococcoidia bacterium]